MAPQKIAVLGSGMSSLVSVFELTSQPKWKEKFDITVYQTGWRLGGKGASGRNQKHQMRNEEHGLHVIFGFYDNVFRIMRACYDELGRNPNEPLATWQDAFKPHSLVVMMEKLGKDTYKRWVLNWPKNSLTPGDGGSFIPPWVYITESLQWGVTLLEEWIKEHMPHLTSPASTYQALKKETQHLEAHAHEFLNPSPEPANKGFFSRVADAIKSEVKLEEEHLSLPLMASFAESLHQDPTYHKPEDHQKIYELAGRFLKWINSILDRSDAFRRFRILVNFGLAIVRGLIKDRVIFPPIDWFKIDDRDFLAWLKEHGAHEDTINSAPAHGVYTAVFSENFLIGAGTGVHALLRMALDYKGSYLWLMQAGMGDTIFAPLMAVLENRGVKFKFFHSVEQLHLSKTAGTRYIDSIDFNIQADVIQEPYKPLIMVKGLPCWPTEPLYDQLVQGEEIEDGGFNLEDWWSPWKGVRTLKLERGKDFDLVILGISVAAIAPLCKELVEDPKNPKFKKMLDAVQTTQIQTAQLWMHPELPQFGWPPDPPVIVPYGYSEPGDRNPIDTWADMTHLLQHEEWPASMHVGNLAYLTAGLTDEEPIPPRSDHGYPYRQQQRVKDITLDWLRRKVGPLWPKAVTPDKGEFNWSWLVDPLNRKGEARFQSQYWHAVNSLSERYVLAVPNSNFARLRANESGYPNLFLTGDWIKTALSVGCLEAATMGGVQTAQAIDPNVPTASGDWLPPLSKTPTYSTLDAADAEKSLTPSATSQTQRADGKSRVSYIERDADLIASPPIGLTMTLYLFMLQAGMKELQAICDRELNLPGSDTIYRPLAPFVMSYFSEINNLPLSNPIGWVLERDFGFWIPVVAGKRRHGIFWPERVLTYTPYIWVDSGPALVGGRTVFGFPKEIGAMTFPKNPKEPANFTLDTAVLPTFSPKSNVVTERLMNVYRTDASEWQELKDGFQNAEHFAGQMMDGLKEVLEGKEAPMIPDKALVKSLLTQFSIGTPVVFLKQFPAADDATKAVYQAIIESSIDITGNMKGGLIWGDYGVDVFEYASHQIVKNLGLSPHTTSGNKSTMKSLFHTWMQFDAVVKPGWTIWQTT